MPFPKNTYIFVCLNVQDNGAVIEDVFSTPTDHAAVLTLIDAGSIAVRSMTSIV